MNKKNKRCGTHLQEKLILNYKSKFSLKFQVDLFVAVKQCIPNLLCTMLKIYPEGLKDTL